jgi:F-type H+-transporting ATPase subunit b
VHINPVTIIFTIINAILIYWFLRKKLFVPVTTFMENRTNLISNQLEDAKQKQESASEIKTQYEQKLLSAEGEGKKVVEEYRAKALSMTDELIEEAKKEASLIRERARVDAEREMERAKDEIKKQVAILSLLAASKSIGEQLDENKHHVLIQDFISKVGV